MINSTKSYLTHAKEIFSVENILYSLMGIGGVLGTLGIVYGVWGLVS